MYKDKIRKYFEDHRDEMLSDIAKLVAIDSQRTEAKDGMPYGEGVFKALSTALSMSEKYGFYTKNWENHVGTASLYNDDERALEIMVHLDIVPPGEGWTKTEPFVMKEIDGRIYGRGTADDKGPAVAALYAMRAIKELEIPLSKNVRIMFGCDEECYSEDIKYYFSKTEPADMTFSPDADFPVINIEKGLYYGMMKGKLKSDGKKSVISISAGEKDNVVPGKAYASIKGFKPNEIESIVAEVENITGTTIELTERGEILDILVKGVPAHASTPEEGCNSDTALLELLKRINLDKSELSDAIETLSEMFPHGDTNGTAAGVYAADDESGEITVSLNIMKYDGENFEAVYDSRMPICSTYESMDPIRNKAAEIGLEFEDDFLPPHYVPSDSEFVKTLIASYEKYSGNKGEAKAMGGATYVHGIKNAVAFGAALEGEDNKMHGADESAVIDTLLMSGMIFADAIYQLCK